MALFSPQYPTERIVLNFNSDFTIPPDWQIQASTVKHLKGLQI